MSNLEVPGTKYKSAFHEVPMTTPNMEDPAMLRAPGSPVTSAPANQTSGRSPNGSPNGNGRETSMDAPTVVGSETAPGKKSSDTRFNRTNQANNELGLSSTRSRMTQDNTTAKLANPLGDLSEEEVLANATKFAETNNLPVEWMRKGAIVAKHPKAFEHLAILDESDREKLRKEINSPYHQPWVLYQLVTACSLAAAIQGMDESVISGAQLFYPQQFGIDQAITGKSMDGWLEGLVNGAPYLCCAVLGCWLTDPMNRLLGRRWTIFISALISFLTCIWAACTDTWWHLFLARFFLGVGIGPKSATVPVYSAECTPAPIRGGLVMQWQMWTAFGIMFGYVADLAFYSVPDKPHITGLNWRLMLGSAGFPALIIMAQVLFLPESPRWLMSKGRYSDAYTSFLRLRGNELLASRDLYYTYVLLEEEQAAVKSRNRVWEMFSVGRNRRAVYGSCLVMFAQQFCGVNAIVYYTATIFTDSGFSNTSALLASWGFGMINWLFAIPGIFTIDKFGRRPLLLITFPLMSILLLFTGFSFWIPGKTARTACVSLGIYLYGIAYSPGEGPVPFTYSSEAYPLYIRELGMSLATTVCWLFNFVVSLTFPALLVAFKPQGAFGWYAAWCAVIFFLVLFFLPETKGFTLEELDQVFAVPTGVHAAYQLYNFRWHFNHYILRSKEPKKELYSFNGVDPSYSKATNEKMARGTHNPV